MPLNRAELYRRITRTARDALAAYYREHPERLDDERSREAIVVSMAGLRAIRSILDEYDITPRPRPTAPGGGNWRRWLGGFCKRILSEILGKK